MANEVEASELAVTSENLIAEEISHIESQVAKGGSLGDVPEDSIEERIGVEFEMKTKPEVLSEINIKEESDPTFVKETETMQVTEQMVSLEPMKSIPESEISEMPDSKRVNEKEKKSVSEPEVLPSSEPEIEPELNEKLGSESNKELESLTKQELTSETKQELESESNQELGSEVKQQLESEGKPELEAEIKPELEADVETEAEEEEVEVEDEVEDDDEEEKEREREREEEEEEEEEDEEEKEEENCEGKIEKPLDDDQDRRNPQYIPKGGAFYEHDNRTSLEDVENKDPQENEKKKKSWKESKESEKWLHDCYNESEQQPKSTAEIIQTYGYDIRCDDAPPRARRRRKYGRGPDKYERSWEDQEAYLIKQNNIGRRGKRKPFGKDEFPPLPNQKSDSSASKPVQRSSIRKKEDGGSKSVNVKLNTNEKSTATSHASRSNHSGNHNSVHSFHTNRKNYNSMNKKLNDDDIKPFRNDDNKWKVNFKHGKQDDFPKPIKTQSIRHTDQTFKRSVETNKISTKEPPHISHITDGINQMTFINKQADVRDIRPKANGPDENKLNEPEMDSPANRQNPKRYSKIRKGFTGIFPPEEVPELDQSDIHKLQQEQQKSQHLNITQPLNMQNVMKRYAGTYGNIGNCVSDFVPSNTSYLQARPIISGIPQQAMSPQGIHQQTLSPQGIPQQALSPQVTGLQAIELQQNPLGQPNFVPQPMYMDAHFTSDVMGPFSGYSPYSGSQTGDVYQPPRGITYYNTECQSSGQKRPPPPRRQKAAIPILPPPE